MSTLKYGDNSILLINNAWSLCCCESQTTAYEAIPCNSMVSSRVDNLCTDYNDCNYQNRKFIATTSKCIGSDYDVCECHLLRIPNWNRVLNTAPSDQTVTIQTVGAGDVTINWGLTEISFSGTTIGTLTYPVTFDFTFRDLRTALITDTSNKIIINTINGLTLDYHVNLVIPFTLNTGASDTTISRTNSGGQLNLGKLRIYQSNETWNATAYEDIVVTNNVATTASNIQTGTDIIFEDNTVKYFKGGTNEVFFPITFDSANCGLEFYVRIHDFIIRNSQVPELEVLSPRYSRYKPDGDDSNFEVWYYQKDPVGAIYYYTSTNIDYYGKVDKHTAFTAWSDTDHYYFDVTPISTTGVDIRNSGCPFERNALSTTSPYFEAGPVWPQYNDGIECCPQGRALIANIPSVGWEIYDSSFTGAIGYGEMPQDDGQFSSAVENGKTFWNLDNNFVIDGECYHISPSFFMVGKEGRLDTYNHAYGKHLHIPADTDFTTDTPENCLVELFIAKFHRDIPWGPFGSYYNGIETDGHPAWESPYDGTSDLFPESYLHNTYATPRVGIDYRPEGYIKTVGTWLETKEIILHVSVHRPISFYIGDREWDDMGYYIEIDESTLSSNMDISNNGGCQAITIAYTIQDDTTVGDFVDEVNNVRAAYINIPIFDFCIASTDARNILLKEVINTSSEMFQQLIATGEWDRYNPLGDPNRLSGSTFPSVPIGYGDMHTRSLDNTRAGDYNHTKKFDAWDGNFDVAGFGVPEVWSTPVGYTGKVTATPPPYIKLLDEEYTIPGDPNQNIDYNTDFRIDGLGVGEEFRSIRSPNMWWTNILKEDKTLVTVRKNTGLPAYLTSLIISVSETASGRVMVSGIGNAYATGVAINTSLAGSGYTLTELVSALNSMVFHKASGAGTYNPIIATTGTYPFPVYLDQSTYYSGTTGRYGPSVGYSQTEYNFSFKEPLLPLSSTNIIGDSSSAELKCTVRQRPGYFDYYWDNIDGRGKEVVDEEYRYKEYPSYCLPTSATVISSDIDCHSTKYYENNFLVGYGCTSPICITTYYYKTSRCATSEFGCDNGNCGDQRPHRFNHEGGDTSNAPYWNYNDLVAVTQPTLYLCKRNIHPSCTTKMMVKVPFQMYVLSTFQYYDASNTLRTAESGQIFWTAGTFGAGYRKRDTDGGQGAGSATALGWNPTGGADDWVLPLLLSDEFCMDNTDIAPLRALASNYIGWCQYLDTTTAEVVTYEDIPKTWPSTAYVAGVTDKPFCSTRVFNYDPSMVSKTPGTLFHDGVYRACLDSSILDCDVSTVDIVGNEGINCEDCYNSEVCPKCLNWDRIHGVNPMLIDGLDTLANMTVLFRPIVQNITEDDWCDNGGCERWDINCATVCNSCIWGCNDDNPCNNTLKAYPIDRSINFIDVITEDNYALCTPEPGPTNPTGGGPPNGLCSCCNCTGGQLSNCCISMGPCIGGTSNYSRVIIVNKNTCYGIIPVGNPYFNNLCQSCTGGGTLEETKTNNVDCSDTSCGSDNCWLQSGEPNNEIDTTISLDCNTDLSIYTPSCGSCCDSPCESLDELVGCSDNQYAMHRVLTRRFECCSNNNSLCGASITSWNITRYRIGEGQHNGDDLFFGLECGGC